MYKSRYQVVSILACVCLVALGIARAEVAVGPFFGDHMMLQRGMKAPVWGAADAGEQVSVEIAGRSAEAVACADGTWQVALKKMDAGGPYVLTIAGASNRIEIQDVLVGEVWICSGQSNMQWTVQNSNNAEEEIAGASFPKMRLFSVPRMVAGEPQETCGGEWAVCSPETVPGFSAAGYFFGRMLHQELDVPVGVIHSSWGGTPAEAWTSMPTLEADSTFASIVERYKKAEANYPEAMAKYEQAVKDWEQAKAEGKDPGRHPSEPFGPTHPHRPAGLYNAMLCPVAPYALRGAIWYQGESNAARAKEYETLFPAMIQDWRELWGQGPFPFYFVQLANFRARTEEPQPDSDWAFLRDAQRKTLSLKNTGMAVIIDIGEADNIHPRNKQDVGKRLALNALAKTYGKDVEYSGPSYTKMRIKGDEVCLAFKHVGGGLVAQGGAALKGFIIAGADKTFVWADARLEGDRVIVRSDDVPEPAAVRYAWADNPECNLYNAAGLPASPFRTDDW